MNHLFEQVNRTPHKTAIVDHGNHFSYQELKDQSEQIASHLLVGKHDLNEARVAFMVSPGFDYVATQWAIWKSGGIAVPLCITYPLPSLTYVLEDTGAEILIVGQEYMGILEDYAQEKGIKLLTWKELSVRYGHPYLPEISPERGAMILYTSGTTSLPKGVLTTHANIESQISTLVDAWKWSSEDYTICLLPLHHVHGIINVVSCTLWAGATVEFLHPFDAKQVFETFLQGRVNVFMAVPTIYFKLISEFESYSETEREALADCMKNFRLMVSGSAALPVSVMEKWKDISGHYLLERYGMTEIGMAISNPYDGERRAGHIGRPLPGVEVRLVDEQNNPIVPGSPGEIQIKGPSVFKEYWKKPEATSKSFTEDGWFKTGDIAVIDEGYYRILGRDSVDIIKSGGYKISALEIEEILRRHPDVKDCGVVGIPDEEWGELVSAGVVAENTLDLKALKDWMRAQMPAYKTPRNYLILKELPRNAMGKVVKNDLKKMFSTQN
ncbi:malonyl-CoA/methylmalonyl-CoA synthetase [Algoriphagus boseongensis]|uniref:Malonyl-CoA/methylmalonyl-CoA synthetase n=1 Tax=Algoriphagus boseongensis TaxID=1442587 RepID=A0A4R6TBC7_9BACT|nr:acyl-CoA synthetase [Algoriphagus boseongensis]TDQ18965.1 malonyl-CoA/methylmalonyl-CoA synthetase [Algoriphagus boseongensis]